MKGWIRFPTVAIGAAALLGMAAAAGAAGQTRSAARIHPFNITIQHSFAAPPTNSDCLAALGVHCYGPPQFAAAYNLTALHAAHIDGRGTTIVIVDAFGSPSIERDLKKFDADYGLPDPPSLRILHPVGAPPPFDVNDDDMVGWAFETTLDVEYAHAFAPGAAIVLVETGGKLYGLPRKDLVDVLSGDNSFGPFTNSDGNTYTVVGYPALPGYDLASGLGTLDAAKFVPALAHARDFN
jgi:subtilase family serine protease